MAVSHQLAIQGGGDQPAQPAFQPETMTIAGLFFSGADEMVFVKAPMDRKSRGSTQTRNTARATKGKASGTDDIQIRRTWRASGPAIGMAPGVSTENQVYVPDPPCVMPFEGDRMDGPTGGTSVQSYWKNYAMWLQCWPGIRETRETIDMFIEQWNKRDLTLRARPFVVISDQQVAVRSTATQKENAKTGQLLNPGQCVLVSDTMEINGTKFLKLGGGYQGWVFESKKDTDPTIEIPVMAEMKKLEIGMWWYRVVCDEFAEVRTSPRHSDENRVGWVLCPKEVFVGGLRARVCGYNFVQLHDGRGWMFERKANVPKNSHEQKDYVIRECEDDFVEGDDQAVLKNLVPPTNEVVEVGAWTYIVDRQPVMAVGFKKYGVMLAPGDIVKVDKRAVGSGSPIRSERLGPRHRLWLRLAEKRGWVAETDEQGRRLMLLQDNDDCAYPTWWRPGADPNIIPEEWMSGTV